MSKQIECVGCGFLAVRNLDTRELVEVEDDLRQKWRLVPANINPPGGGEILVYSDFPVCFRRAADLKADAALSHKPNHSDQIKAAITQDRTATCTGDYTPWQQGFTPKEHQEMLNTETMLVWQREREAEDRQWREDRDRDDRTWRTEQEKLTNRRHWQAIRWGALFAVLVIVVANALSAWVQSKIGG